VDDCGVVIPGSDWGKGSLIFERNVESGSDGSHDEGRERLVGL
jgi:hypothetical protein